MNKYLKTYIHKCIVLLLSLPLWGVGGGLLCSCASDIFSSSEDQNTDLEITTVNAHVDGSGTTSRAVALGDTVGRKDFVANDVITFTEIKRTVNPIPAFTYTQGISYKRSSENSWIRATNDPERIYWSDANSAHTFKGYGCPQDANVFDWNAVEETGGAKVYFGSLGVPTETGDIDYTNTPLPVVSDGSPVGESAELTAAQKDEYYKSGNKKIIKDDILLTYNEQQMADAGGQVATVKYYHGLCNVRVIVNISGFSASADAVDSRSVVTGLVLKDMLTMYKWNQTSYTTTKLIEGDQTHLNSIYGTTNTPSWDQKKATRAWIRHPEGNGTGQSKTFTFYALAVPNTNVNQRITFDVTYPDPLNPAVNKTEQYDAQIDGIEYRAGYCTTINISLNHKNDKMTVGAEYVDWEFVETPDQTNLKKNATMLTSDMLVRTNYTIVGDEKATKDDATWLYNDNGTIKDTYGNDGSAEKPFIICTAQQLVSFMEEVKSGNNGAGRNFAGLFIKLDADLTLQSTIETPTKTEKDADGNETTIRDDSKLITWPGIGYGDNVFNGFFLGNDRHVNNLYGKAFFTTLGPKAVIDKLDFANMIEVNGTGVIADVNKGLICGCNVDGNIIQAQPENISISYVGSLVGTNESFIIGCTHKGQVTGYGTIAGLVGYNKGTLIACYHSGTEINAEKDKYGVNVYAGVGAYTEGSQAFSCYFNSTLNKFDYATLIPGKMAFPRSTAQMQSNAFVNAETDIIIDNDAAGNPLDVSTFTNDQQFQRHFSLNKAMDVFCDWLESLPEGKSYTTNCRTFTAEEITFLKTHYGNSSHRFQYTPGSYPKIQ